MQPGPRAIAWSVLGEAIGTKASPQRQDETRGDLGSIAVRARSRPSSLQRPQADRSTCDGQRDPLARWSSPQAQAHVLLPSRASAQPSLGLESAASESRRAPQARRGLGHGDERSKAAGGRDLARTAGHRRLRVLARNWSPDRCGVDLTEAWCEGGTRASRPRPLVAQQRPGGGRRWWLPRRVRRAREARGAAAGRSKGRLGALGDVRSSSEHRELRLDQRGRQARNPQTAPKTTGADFPRKGKPAPVASRLAALLNQKGSSLSSGCPSQ